MWIGSPIMNVKAKNPIIVLALLLCGILSAHATTYYVSSTSGNDSYTSTQATSMATPWRSLGKVNSFWSSLNPGDTIKLQAGSVFTQALVVLEVRDCGSSYRPYYLRVGEHAGGHRLHDAYRVGWGRRQCLAGDLFGLRVERHMVRWGQFAADGSMAECGVQCGWRLLADPGL